MHHVNSHIESCRKPPQTPVRILEVVSSMKRAGVETWLMHMLRRIDRSRFHVDFLVHTSAPCDFDEEIRSYGCDIIPCPAKSRPWTYARQLRRILRKHGPYDVIHSHIHHFSGLVMRVARAARVPMRITHSHNDTREHDSRASLTRRFYLRLCERWIRNSSTSWLACSHDAAATLFAPDANAKIVHCGIDLQPFSSPVDRAAIRAELGIASDAFVLGHVGRFFEQKNHSLLVEITAETIKREPRAVLLLVGDGPLRPQIEEKLTLLGIRERVIFTGVRADIHRLMLGAMDSFVFPSLYEGLGLVLIEAQAAGLPCIISDVVPREADIVLPLIRRIPLSASPAVWADAMLANKSAVNVPQQRECLQLVEQSSFNISTSINRLEMLYGGCNILTTTL